MSKLFLFLTSIIFTIVTLRCNNHKQNSPQSPVLQTILINAENSNSENALRTITLDKKIRLETNNNCLIGNIKTIKIINSDIYLIQSTSAQTSLLRFDKNGSFVSKITDYGRGPGEILDVRDFFVENDKIEILTNLNIYQYTNEGVFIKEVLRTPFPGVGFFKQKGYYYIFHSVLKPFTITKLNSNGNLIKEFLENRYIDAISGNDKVIILKDHILLFSAVRDTIYTIIDDSVIPMTQIELKNMLPASKAYRSAKNALMFINEINNRKEYCTIDNYFENEDLIVLKYFYNRKAFLAIYNKKNKKSDTIKSSTIDIITGSQYSSPVCLTEDNRLIFPIYNMERKINNSGEFNNPELWFYKINI